MDEEQGLDIKMDFLLDLRGPSNSLQLSPLDLHILVFIKGQMQLKPLDSSIHITCSSPPFSPPANIPYDLPGDETILGPFP